MMKKFNFVNKWVVALVALFGISLISAGVFAAATITINGGTAVNLGAGAIGVNVCDSAATISTDQTYSSSNQRYELTTVTLSGINDSTCAGKTLSLAFKAGGSTKSTTWAVVSGQTQYVYSVNPAIDTAGSDITTIAIAAQ
jgi:hypothetical protein